MIKLDQHGITGLLEFLSDTQPLEPGQVEGWTFARVTGGANNLVYRATQGDDTFAVKFCIRDVRDRVGREYGALSLLENLGLELAPKALLLERERYAQPVLVQTWLEGSVMPAPVSADAWDTLLNYYAALHRVTPEQGTLPLALHTASSLAEGKALIGGHLERLPRVAYPPDMAQLIEAFTAWDVPAWPQPPLSFCRVDPNPGNFLRTDRGLRSVDWENSGWGDPAFELADLLTHPAYAAVAEGEVAGIAERYAALSSDDALHVRLEAYLGIGLMYWVVRFARMLYEVPRGLDTRLVGWPETWEGDTRRKYESYVQRARAFFRGA